MPLSCRDQLRIIGLRRAVAGVVVGLSLLLAVPRRAAEDVVELRGRPQGVAALRRCPSSRRGRRRGAWVVVGLSLLLDLPLRAAEDVVERRVRRRGVDAPVV